MTNIITVCGSCGQRNRLPLTLPPGKVCICGACKEPLDDDPEDDDTCRSCGSDTPNPSCGECGTDDDDDDDDRDDADDLTEDYPGQHIVGPDHDDEDE